MRPFASLSSTLLPLPAGPSRIRVSPGITVKRDVFENLLAFKPDRYVIEDEDRLRRIFLGRRGCGLGRGDS